VSSAPDLTSRILRHERALIAISVAALVALCWWYIAAQGTTSGSMDMAVAREPRIGALVVMWWLMMVAMMLPSAAPAVLLYSRVRDSRGRDSAIGGTWVFLAGYLCVWMVFSVGAALAQKLFTGPAMVLQDRFAEAAVLVGAGLYQLSPMKFACMRQCRSPAQFLSRHWRSGWEGAMALGVRHGAYCVGCCWVLMGLLFVGGIMNLWWVAGLTFLVAGEKLLPDGQPVRHASAIALLLWGAGRLLL
jgi:predicted metal-binding membrane protein